MDTEWYLESMESPIGILCVTASDKGLRAINIITDPIDDHNPNEITTSTILQLSSYFEGKQKEFDIAFDLSGYPEFTVKVWHQLLKIPYGHTISYRQLAISVGTSKHTRAVGMANSRNPIPIIIPCHRVIGSNGDLTGYALGLDVKKTLLKIENPLKTGWEQGEFLF